MDPGKIRYDMLIMACNEAMEKLRNSRFALFEMFLQRLIHIPYLRWVDSKM